MFARRRATGLPPSPARWRPCRPLLVPVVACTHESTLIRQPHCPTETVTMAFAAPPEFAAWRHRDARDGFEVVFLRAGDGGYRLEGHTAAVEDGQAWAVRYRITLDAAW